MWKIALGMCLLLGVSVAYGNKSSKSYDVTIPQTMTVGSNVLQPGDYKLRVEGTTAFFTKEYSRKTVQVPVVVGTTEQKVSATEVEMAPMPGGGERLTEIRLHGTVKLDFPN